MRHPGVADTGNPSEKGLILNLTAHPIVLTAGIMTILSLLLIPLFVRFAITPLILFRTYRHYFSEQRAEQDRWQEESSRDLFLRMYRKISKILFRSESFQISEDLKTLLSELIPPEKLEEGKTASIETLELSFSPVRLLETLFLAYEDLHNEVEKRFLLRYLLKRRLKWFRPFQRGMRINRIINTIPVVEFFNRKGLFTQGLRLILIPVFGLPGILFYALRSLLIRGVWSGLIRYYYTLFLMKGAYFIIYLYGGNTETLTRRKARFSKKEIIRTGAHFDRELTMQPPMGEMRETLQALLRRYDKILKEAGFERDSGFTGTEKASTQTSRKRRVKSFLRRSLKALNHQLSEEKQHPGLRETALQLLMELPEERFPGMSQPWMYYRVIQVLNVSYKLLMITLSRTYTNAPGSWFAMEKISVDLIRQARDFSRQPLVSLLSRTGKNSYSFLKPLLKLRKLNRLRQKATPAGVVSLSVPFFGKMIQERWKELILYRIGRAVVRYSILEDHSLL